MLGKLVYVSLLLVNAAAILNEERFLARIGWASSRLSRDSNTNFQQPYDNSGQVEIGVKARLIDLITAVRTLMRIPLIALNTLVILYELVWG